jgi:hypothetical protein
LGTGGSYTMDGGDTEMDSSNALQPLSAVREVFTLDARY